MSKRLSSEPVSLIEAQEHVARYYALARDPNTHRRHSWQATAARVSALARDVYEKRWRKPATPEPSNQ
jgi:hypothetical protein